MPSLRQHAKDAAIGAVTQTNLEHVARILEAHAKRLRHPIWRWFHADRKHALDVAMLAAVFARVRGVPEPLPAQFDARLTSALESRRD